MQGDKALYIYLLFQFYWCYAFVFAVNYGLIGTSISMSITYISNLVIVTSIITFKKGLVHPESWHFFNSDSFKNFWEFLKYGILSTLMLCFDWWYFELVGIFAGILSVKELASNTLITSMTGTLFQFVMGLSFASSNLVGYNIGGMKPKTAKRYYLTSVSIIA